MVYEFAPGILWEQVRKITLAEWDLMLVGYHRRLEKEINQTRNIMTAILNIQGKSLKNETTPQKLWPLEMDIQHQKRMITTMAQAMKLLKEYL